MPNVVFMKQNSGISKESSWSHFDTGSFFTQQNFVAAVAVAVVAPAAVALVGGRQGRVVSEPGPGEVFLGSLGAQQQPASNIN